MLYCSDDILATLDYFATTGLLKQGTEEEYTILGIFDMEAGSFGDDLKLSAPNPVYICRTTDTDNIKQNDVIKINCINYKVRDFRPDGTGVTVLELLKIK